MSAALNRDSWRTLEPFMGSDVPDREVVALADVKALLEVANDCGPLQGDNSDALQDAESLRLAISKAITLANDLQSAVQTYPQMSEDEPGGYCRQEDQLMADAADSLRALVAVLQAVQS